MGSATIKTNLGAGQYIVELTKSQAAIVSQKTSLTTRKTEIDSSIAAKEIELAALNVTMNEKYEALKTAVGDYAVADPPTKALKKAVTDAQKAYITAQSNWNKKQTEINLLGLELVSINKRLEEIETALAVESRTVWCVDYSTALTGSVGTIEINGEADAINIMPGGATGAGLLQHPLAMTPSGVFVNSAKLPAWQKWMPTYRAGVITSISGNTCNVALDAALSSAQSIDINQADALTNVTIKYMTCDGLIFQVGDHVVVQFVGQSQSSPKIVGFVSNPRMGGWKFKFMGWSAPSVGETVDIAIGGLNESGQFIYGDSFIQKVTFWDSEGFFHVIPMDSPADKMYVRVKSIWCCRQTYPTQEDFYENGSLPFGTYTVSLWGTKTEISSSPGGDEQIFGSLPWIASYSHDIVSDISISKTYEGNYAFAAFDPDEKIPGTDQYYMRAWPFFNGPEIIAGRIVVGGDVKLYSTLESCISVTINASPKYTTGFEYYAYNGGIEGGESNVDTFVTAILRDGAKFYLDASASVQIGWESNGPSIQYTIAAGQTPRPSNERFMVGGYMIADFALPDPYLQNTTSLA